MMGVCLVVVSTSRAAELDIDMLPADPLRYAIWENDSGPLKANNNTDRHYSNGMLFGYGARDAEGDGLNLALPGWDDFGEPEATARGWVVAQLMFTPNDITARTLIPDDRPYAGYLYLGWFWQRARENVMDHYQLDMGVVGESAMSDHVQEAFHKLVDTRNPSGWDHQLRDEFAIQLTARRKWRRNLAEHDFFDIPLRSQLITDVGAALGTVYRNVEGGMMLRVGHNLPDDYGPSRLSDLGAATAEPRPGISGYGFVRAGGRVVEHDIFLEGNTWEDSHAVEEEWLVGEVSLGVAFEGWRDDRRWRVSYTQTFQTDTFEGQRHGDAYATLSIACTMWF